MADELVLTDPWQDLRGHDPENQDHRQALHDQLTRELSPGHPLHGQTVTILGRSHQRDDILITPANGGWAIVHLTWKQTRDTPPWPITTFYDTAQELAAALQADDLD